MIYREIRKQQKQQINALCIFVCNVELINQETKISTIHYMYKKNIEIVLCPLARHHIHGGIILAYMP